ATISVDAAAAVFQGQPSSSGDSAVTADTADTCVCSLPLPPRPFNPFYHRAGFFWYHYLTVPLLGLLLFPVRLLLLILSLALAFLVSFVTQIGGKATAPLSPWRSWVADHLLLNIGRMGAFVGGYQRIHLKGRRASVREAPLLVAAPHTSLTDTVVFFCQRPMLAPVTKAPKNFFYNVMVPAGEAVVVYRDNRRMRAKAAEEIVDRARSCLNGGGFRQLLVFPEGTCTNGGALIGFRLGAFAPGVPVQPVLVRHRDPLQLQCWAVDGPSMFHMIFRCGSRVYSELHVEFLPVYHPSAEERANPQLYANNVRDLLARHAGLPVSDHSYTDVLLFKAARRRGLRHLGFPLSGLRRLFRRLLPASASAGDQNDCGEDKDGGYDQAVQLLNRLTPGPPKLLCPHELAAEAALPGPLESWMRLVFDIFDWSGSGRIDPRWLHIAAALLCCPDGAEAILRDAMMRMSSRSDGDSLIDAVAMETALHGLVGMTPELSRAVMAAAPSTVNSEAATAESCASHAMQFKSVRNLLKLNSELAAIFVG
uniref:PlsC domain-containing protein n=2 Tax=Macrostomum lignano TaxID=282301 RepID=A0A1I8H4U0_9PLAT